MAEKCRPRLKARVVERRENKLRDADILFGVAVCQRRDSTVESHGLIEVRLSAS